MRIIVHDRACGRLIEEVALRSVLQVELYALNVINVTARNIREVDFGRENVLAPGKNLLVIKVVVHVRRSESIGSEIFEVECALGTGR